MAASNTWETAPAKLAALKNNIHIWLCNLTISEQLSQQYYKTLSSEEHARHQRLKFDKHKKRFNASHGFLREVLARYTKSDASCLKFEMGENGKPFLVNSNPLQFNG